MLNEIAKTMQQDGGRIFYVGGCVRDNIIGKPSKDIDVEIYGLSLNRLIEILSRFGEVNTVGKCFGIIKVKGLDIDFSIPRSERKVTDGHTGFEVEFDSCMLYEEACRRRDMRMNAILVDVITGEVIDPFQGRKDIEDRVIRHIDDSTFIEDPLRVYRAIQFAARFDFTIAPETLNLCKGIDLSSLSKERVYDELMKMLLKADKPSIGLTYMRELGVTEKYFPLLHNLIGCTQPIKHHPEGDAWTHTLLVVDEAAKLRDKSTSPDSFMLAAMLHDIGKPPVRDVQDGIIHFYGHDAIGSELALEFLKSLTDNKRILAEVPSLIRNHMKPIFLYKFPDSAIRRLANKCDIREVMLLHEADHKGRGGELGKDFEPIAKWFNEKIKEMSLDKKIDPLVKGRDLISLGLKPGVYFGEILKKAFDKQLDGLSYEEIMYEIKQELKEGE